MKDFVHKCFNPSEKGELKRKTIGSWTQKHEAAKIMQSFISTRESEVKFQT